MIPPHTCPLCKYSAPTELSGDGNLKLVKCEDCGTFVITFDAEQEVIKHVVLKAKFVEQSQNLSGDEILEFRGQFT